MIDQLQIDSKFSYKDFEASVKERKIHKPKKKSIRETVPFSNKTYDFSAINGEVYWEDRELEYIFEIMADSPVELEKKKSLFASWVMSVDGAELYDPFMPDYYFVNVTFDDIDEEDDESVEKTTITVKFKAYPYMRVVDGWFNEWDVSDNEDEYVTIPVETCHPVPVEISADGSFIFEKLKKGWTYFPTNTPDAYDTFASDDGGTFVLPFKLDPGEARIRFRPYGATWFSISFEREIF